MNAPTAPDRSFAQNCAYCGARFEVHVSAQSGDERRLDYACPECGKTYPARGVTEPRVTLLQRRDDGKTDRYSETMF